MGWADDMYEAGYTPEHGGLMPEERQSYNGRSSKGWKSKKKSHHKHNNSGKTWTDNDRNKVVELYLEGFSVESIASEFGRTPYAIAWQLYNMDKITDFEREGYK